MGKLFFCALKHLSSHLQWWPRFTRVFRPIPNIELFKPSIKQVESHFGTAVASYFVLLRWLLYMNLAISVVWTLFVLIPQFVVEPYLRTQRRLTAPCVYTNGSYDCPYVYNTDVYFLAFPNCKSQPSAAVMAEFCAEDNSPIVTALLNGTKNSTGCPYSSIEYYLCSPYQPDFDLISLITGRGGYSDTWLFLGHYVNFTEYKGISYNRPVATLICTAMVFGISFIMLVVRYFMLRYCGSCVCVCIALLTSTYVRTMESVTFDWSPGTMIILLSHALVM